MVQLVATSEPLEAAGAAFARVARMFPVDPARDVAEWLSHLADVAERDGWDPAQREKYGYVLDAIVQFLWWVHRFRGGADIAFALDDLVCDLQVAVADDA